MSFHRYSNPMDFGTSRQGMREAPHGGARVHVERSRRGLVTAGVRRQIPPAIPRTAAGGRERPDSPGRRQGVPQPTVISRLRRLGGNIGRRPRSDGKTATRPAEIGRHVMRARETAVCSAQQGSWKSRHVTAQPALRLLGIPLCADRVEENDVAARRALCGQKWLLSRPLPANCDGRGGSNE